MISCFVKHNRVHRSTKRNNKMNSENISFGNSHTVILKTWRRVNIKIQNSTIMVITVMKSERGYNPETPYNFPHHSSVMSIE